MRWAKNMLTKFSITLAPILVLRKNSHGLWWCTDEHCSTCTQCGIHGSKPLLKARLRHPSLLHSTQSRKELSLNAEEWAHWWSSFLFCFLPVCFLPLYAPISDSEWEKITFLVTTFAQPSRAYPFRRQTSTLEQDPSPPLFGSSLHRVISWSPQSTSLMNLACHIYANRTVDPI